MLFSLQSLVILEMRYRYAFLLPGMVIEGPIVTIIAGFLTTQGTLGFWESYVIAVFADLIGDTALYSLGFFGGRRLVRRYGKYIGLKESRIDALESHFVRHSCKTILVGKLTHGVGAAILAAAGVAKMPYKKFIAVNFLATLVKSLLFLWVGVYVGKAYDQANSYLNLFALGGFLLVPLILLLYVVPKKLKKYFGVEKEE